MVLTVVSVRQGRYKDQCRELDASVHLADWTLTESLSVAATEKKKKSWNRINIDCG